MVGPHVTEKSPVFLTTEFHFQQFRAQIMSTRVCRQLLCHKGILDWTRRSSLIFFHQGPLGGPWARDPGDSLPVPALSSLTAFCCLSCFAFWACSFLDFRNRSQARLLVEQGGASRKGRGERAPAPSTETPAFCFLLVCVGIYSRKRLLYSDKEFGVPWST